MRKNNGLLAAALGVGLNFALSMTKLYIGISVNSLTIYCDAVNNAGDTLACVVAALGFLLIKKQNERQTARTQSLFTLFISLFIAATGIYFVYGGIQRMMYPLPVSYLVKYAVLLGATVPVKVFMGLMFVFFHRRQPSPVLKALSLDCFLDCFVTIAALMSLLLVSRINYAVDGLFAIVTGSFVSASAIKNTIVESKTLIND